MALTISRKDKENLELEISTMQFVRDFIARRIRQECDSESKETLAKTLDYFDKSLEAHRVDINTFTAVDNL